jgi:hypothetical protein
MVILINGVPSGGGGLPTAPLGQVLISQGDGVPPIFSAAPVATSGWHTTSADYNSYVCTINEGALRAVKVHPYERTYAGIGAGEFVGELSNISDSTVNTPGAVIAGGGTFHVLARWNGTNWKVVAG